MLIIDAAQYAEQKHRGQFRKYANAPAITHIIRVGGRTACHPLATEEGVAVAFLHDTVEDCPDVTLGDIARLFGMRVASLVDYLTIPPRQEGQNRAARQHEHRERLRWAEPIVKVIKMIDRIDNLREFDHNDKFGLLYSEESLKLLEVLREADTDLGFELEELAYKLKRNSPWNIETTTYPSK